VGEGFFAFDTDRDPGSGEVAVDAHDLVLESGLNRASWSGNRSTRRLRNPARAVTRFCGRRSEPGHGDWQTGGPSLASLKLIMTELRSPASAVRSAWLLRYAGTVVRRRVLFSISKEGIRGMARPGWTASGTTERRLRRVRVPVDEPSVFRRVVEVKTATSGAVRRGMGPVSRRAARWRRPSEVAIVPWWSTARRGLLYGDNLPDGGRSGRLTAWSC